MLVSCGAQVGSLTEAEEEAEFGKEFGCRDGEDWEELDKQH